MYSVGCTASNTVRLTTTQFYMEVENEHRNEPREHYQSRCPGLRNFRQHETVASDTYFPTKVTNQGHTSSQMFFGLDSDFWVTYPMKTESANGEATTLVHMGALISSGLIMHRVN
jgi:hypothetical protein